MTGHTSFLTPVREALSGTHRYFSNSSITAPFGLHWKALLDFASSKAQPLELPLLQRSGHGSHLCKHLDILWIGLHCLWRSQIVQLFTILDGLPP